MVPGDTLELTTEIIKVKGPIGVGKAVARVDGKVACMAELTFEMCIRDRYRQRHGRGGCNSWWTKPGCGQSYAKPCFPKPSSAGKLKMCIRDRLLT